MGNKARGPKTEKQHYYVENSNLRVGICQMQGWRTTMEDSILCEIDFEEKASIFGVMDGHGGELVSQFVSSNFLSLLLNMISYQKGTYEQALLETFLKLDELLRLTRINDSLKEHQLALYKENLGCYFISLQELNNYSLDDSTNLGTYKSNKSYENIMNLFQKDKILDLTEEEKVPELKYNNLKIIDEEHKLSKHSLNPKSTLPVSTELNHLVAKDMGTTANILLIKNNNLYLANVGDSFSVMYKNGKAIPLNQEHKTTLISESDRIIKSGAQIINNRVEGRLNLTRAIGDLEFKSNSSLKFYEQAVIAYPEITKIKLSSDIEFIVMGCDGVWDCVEPQSFCEHISKKLKENVSINCIIDQVFSEIISETNNGKLNILYNNSANWN